MSSFGTFLFIQLLIINYYNIHNMSNQTTRENPNIQPQEICTHIGKLSKKNVQNLSNYNYIPMCCTCHISLNPNNIKIGVNQISLILCLHCGQLFCSNSLCQKQHTNEDHLFYIKLKLKDEPPSLLKTEQKNQNNQSIGQIYCKMCGDIDKQTKLQIKQQDPDNNKKSESIKKLIRFTQFIHSVQKSVSQLVIAKFNEFLQLYCEDEPEVFGLKNLGNTCFLNSVLQVLYYTQPFNHIYYNYVSKKHSDWNYLVSKEKQKRRQIEYFYDQIIQKNQSSSWHLVGDKKTKNKQRMARRELQKFVPSGFVKDSKFNLVISKFIQNVQNFLRQVQQSKTKQKLIFQPVQILERLCSFDKKYQLQQQQDAQELLILMIDILSQGQMMAMIGNSQDKKQKYRKAETLLGRQKLSPTQQVFGSYLASHIVCLSCNKQSWTVDFTYHFPVPIEGIKADQKSFEGDGKTPIKGINYYKSLYYPNHKKQNTKSSNNKMLLPLFHSERLTNKQNYYHCQKCSGLSAIKQFYIIDPPEIFMISFKRFEHNRKDKITKHVRFEEFIQISDFVLQEKDQEQQTPDKQQIDHSYQLYGVIVHKGESISSGHYICFVKRKIKQSQHEKQRAIWYQFSDEKSKKVTSKDVFKQEAYILLYQRLNSK